MTAPRASASNLRAIQSAIEETGDDQVARIVHLTETMDRQDAETILAPIRARLRVLRLARPLQLSRLLGAPLEPLLINGVRSILPSVGVPRAALQPLCDAVARLAPDLIAKVQSMITGANTRDATRVRAAGSVLWSGAGAALRRVDGPPDSWAKAGLSATSFPHLAASVGVCLETALQLDTIGDPTMNLTNLESSLATMMRQAAVVGPHAWSMLLVLMFCAFPEAQLPRHAAFGQSDTDLRGPAQAALQQIWAWIEAAESDAPHNLTDTAASLRQRGAVLNALASSRGQRPRVAAEQSNLRAVYTAYLVEAAQDRLIAPMEGLSHGLSDAATAVMEDHARGLRRLLIELRSFGAAAGEVSSQAQIEAPLLEAAHAARQCTAMRAIDRARLLECLGYSQDAARLLGA